MRHKLVRGVTSQKKDKYRRKGKGRRCCLGERIYSIPCSTSCFAQDDLKNILFFQIILVQFSQRGKELNNFFSQNRSDDLCLLFCLYPFSMTEPNHSPVGSETEIECDERDTRQIDREAVKAKVKQDDLKLCFARKSSALLRNFVTKKVSFQNL